MMKYLQRKIIFWELLTILFCNCKIVNGLYNSIFIFGILLFFYYFKFRKLF